MEDYDVIGESEKIIQAREEDYESMKENMADRVAEYAIDNDLGTQEVADLVCFAANSYGTMPIADVVEVTRNAIVKINEESELDKQVKFIRARMHPYYEASIDDNGELDIILTLKHD